MVPLEKSRFRFACHPEVPCFMVCCRKLTLPLYPYDIIMLKKRLAIHSADFLGSHTMAVQDDNPFFPSIHLKMADNEEQTCPFLSATGCTVYEDRPTACRTYPLERALDRQPSRNATREYYFLTHHPYCKGHEEKKEWSVKEWLRDQKVLYYNKMNDLWSEMDGIFRTNPWKGEGAYGPKQQIAFMVCYNVDGFRAYLGETRLLRHFKIPGAIERAIATDDEALLTFGLDWLKHVLTGAATLKPR